VRTQITTNSNQTLFTVHQNLYICCAVCNFGYC